MKFKNLFETAISDYGISLKETLLLNITDSAEDIRYHLGGLVNKPGVVKEDIADIIINAVALYSHYDDDIETLKSVIGRQLDG